MMIVLQGLKFGIVGAAAAATHVLVFVGLIELFDMPPLWANLGAFCVAFVVSFLGHFHWTFHAESAEGARAWKDALPRFITVALVGLGLNSLVVFAVVNVLALPYLIAVVLMVTAVPAVVFVLSKFWAFA
jgi:putative flippase GtrA